MHIKRKNKNITIRCKLMDALVQKMETDNII